MTRVTPRTGELTAEEFHYMYDGAGRMQAASFAMSPASGYAPSSGQPWYTADTSAPGMSQK